MKNYKHKRNHYQKTHAQHQDSSQDWEPIIFYANLKPDLPKPMILQVPKPVVLMILAVLNLKDLSMLLLNFKFLNFLILSDNFLCQSQFLELFDNQFRAKCKSDRKIPLMTYVKPYGKNYCPIKDALNTWYLKQRDHKKYCRYCANCRANRYDDGDCYCNCLFCEQELRYAQELDYDDDASN